MGRRGGFGARRGFSAGRSLSGGYRRTGYGQGGRFGGGFAIKCPFTVAGLIIFLVSYDYGYVLGCIAGGLLFVGGVVTLIFVKEDTKPDNNSFNINHDFAGSYNPPQQNPYLLQPDFDVQKFDAKTTANQSPQQKVEYNCKNCTAPLKLDATTWLFNCHYCGGCFRRSDFPLESPRGNNLENFALELTAQRRYVDPKLR